MSWWSLDWLPTLPSFEFALPSGVQKRFISFVLRQSLGRFLKPGQLDAQQVDSQIGSGYVQIRDLELDNDEISKLIAGLPLRLHDGSLGKATVRIPLPNPLTSAVGLSLETLHLTFYLTPEVAVREDPVDLADSVASVAESFIHEELSPDEEAALRESFHPGMPGLDESIDEFLPGGLNPFIRDVDSAASRSDSQGVPIFASLIERVLARFQFEANDVKITLVNPGQAGFTFSIENITYRTHGLEEPPSPAANSKYEMDVGGVRTVTISGASVTTRDLRPLSPTLSSPIHTFEIGSAAGSSTSYTRTVSPRPASPQSDTSDSDETAQMLMSQSIVTLPIRPPSPASTVASSMYESAISSVSPAKMGSLHAASGDTDLADSAPDVKNFKPSDDLAADSARSSPRTWSGGATNRPVNVNEIEDELLISFGSDPIVFRLRTSVLLASPASASHSTPSATSHGHTSFHNANEPAIQPRPNNGSMSFEASIGVISSGLRARHIRAMLDMMDALDSHVPPPGDSSHHPSTRGDAFPKWLEKAELQMHVRALAILLMPSSDLHQKHQDGISQFYAHPLVPPKLPHGYVRTHLERLSVGAKLSGPPSVPVSRHRHSSTQPSASVDVSASLSELSICAFILAQASATEFRDESSLWVVPLLLTDPNLPLQYSLDELPPDALATAGPILPAFDIVDWTNPLRRSTSARLSLWRCRPQVRAQSPPIHSGLSPVVLGLSPRIPVESPTSPTGGAFPRPSTSPGRSDTSAVTVKCRIPLGPPRQDAMLKADVHVVPLHVFIDLGLALASTDDGVKSEVLTFLDEVTASSQQNTRLAVHPMADEVLADHAQGADAKTPAGTPRARKFRDLSSVETEQEHERQRLERLVMEDLDLELDYRYESPGHKAEARPARVSSTTRHKTQARDVSPIVSVNLSMVRVEIRAPAPNNHEPRSGALIFDVHDFTLSSGLSPRGHSIRFADASFNDEYSAESLGDGDRDVLVSMTFKRMLLAASQVGEDRATSISTVSSHPVDVVDVSRAEPITLPATSGVEGWPTIRLTRSTTQSSNLSSTAILVDLPAIYSEISKVIFDAVQLWADDVSRLLEGVPDQTQRQNVDNSTSASLIGSRYFARTREGSQASASDLGTPNAGTSTARGETAIKVGVGAAAIRLLLARSSEGMAVRPFDVTASDIDILLELKPEGQDETVLTVDIADVAIREMLQPSFCRTFVGLTLPSLSNRSSQSALKLRFTSLIVPETMAKESRVRLTLCGLTLTCFPELAWVDDLSEFVKAPPGVFESVVPSEKTSLSIKIVDTSVQLLAPNYPGALISFIGELSFSTSLEGTSQETTLQFRIPSLSLFLTDDLSTVSGDPTSMRSLSVSAGSPNAQYWKVSGYALLTELTGVEITIGRFDSYQPPLTRITIADGDLRLHLCADTLTVLTAFVGHFSSIFASPEVESPPIAQRRGPTEISDIASASSNLSRSVDEQAFSTLPEIGAAPDMIQDDLPTNPDYLDESFGAAAGLRELEDEDIDDLDFENPQALNSSQVRQDSNTTRFGGETIKMLRPDKLHIVQNFYNTMTPDATEGITRPEETTLQIYAQICNATLFLYDGYDWARTRRIIEDERKQMRRKLAKIRQLVASGQTPDPSVEETNTLLFNSVYIGLEHNVDELEPGALIAAIDEELDDGSETASQSSWQSLQPQVAPVPTPPARSGAHAAKPGRQHMTRSKAPSIEFRFEGLHSEVDHYRPDKDLVSTTLVTVKDVEILDHVKTSTWRKFLTALRRDSRGNVRETDSDMVRFELRSLHPVPNHPSVEARLRAKILPLRLHVDQDALDFLKKFFSFKDPDALPVSNSDSSDEIYFQHAEVFPIGLKLDYKPRRVDYRALRDGRTIELMNFFHFDGAEMTLRHITLTGITGWSRFFDLLNDLWTPDVKATQLVDVISGVAPIRSVVNVGSGVADLVLLPIAQYKKDGRVVRGLQKGATAFVKSTAMEAIKLGAKLATGTQVILEQAETVLGGQGLGVITTEAVQTSPLLSGDRGDLVLDEDDEELISRYADQPMNVQEGVRTAYRSLRSNFSSAAQTILAVPMEVYERSGNEGAVRAVVRAVPIAVLKPMIGASEAVSKTLLGLHNTLDPNARLENEAKYKQR